VKREAGALSSRSRLIATIKKQSSMTARFNKPGAAPATVSRLRSILMPLCAAREGDRTGERVLAIFVIVAFRPASPETGPRRVARQRAISLKALRWATVGPPRTTHRGTLPDSARLAVKRG